MPKVQVKTIISGETTSTFDINSKTNLPAIKSAEIKAVKAISYVVIKLFFFKSVTIYQPVIQKLYTALSAIKAALMPIDAVSPSILNSM